MKKNMVGSLFMAASLVVSLPAVVLMTGCAGDTTHRSTGTYVDDQEIRDRIRTDLIAAKGIDSGDIKLEVYKAKVQLSGFVDTPEQKRRAGEIASNVDGVRWVMNDLAIKIPVSQAAGTAYASPIYTNGVNSPVQEPAGAAPISTPSQGPDGTSSK
jgi:hypothetical protein